ncbi:dienelactone hydrolase family protein [Psychrobacter jeotgali]|uniref:dienelactone hydrolase family protein n=1 Tax=Psychrobacter jeotgali TaxID=179010 RepID=UPI00191AE90C|nr:hypothetical protein [Psychrobacter jeotgali]
MTHNRFFSKAAGALGPLTLSMSVFCVNAIAADHPAKTALSTATNGTHGTVLSSSLSTADCIPDTVIDATTLADTQANGPFSVTAKPVPRQAASGFGGGTIFYPNHTEGCGLLGGIAVIPGYVSYENSIKWWGPRLASWGFVVITINTNSIYDNPDSRATQLSAALDHIFTDSTVGNMVDRNRLGVIGWSMGGGGALRLATDRRDIRAIMPLAPYHDKGYEEVKTPTLVIACEHDRIASNKKYTNIFYDKLTGPKMKVEVNNASHFCPSYRFNEKLLSKPGIAWMQRYINDDTRFDKFLCANENYSDSPRFSAYDYANC